MNTVSVFAIATLFAASVSSVAVAQTGADVDVGADANVGVEGDVDVGADGEVTTQTGVTTQPTTAPQTGAATQVEAGVERPHYGEIMTSLQAAGDASADIQAVEASTSAQVVLLSDLYGDAAENAGALEQAIEAHEDRIDGLRGAIQTNAELSGALEAEGYTVDDVVAVSTGAYGDVLLIVDA
ncbi:MAG: hypothetical protein JJU15_01135 [Pararhodobacter sp.]|nr:hypothetical protein [Pararhodobacter sp.]